MSHCKRASKPRRSAAALMVVAGGLAGAAAAPGALGQTKAFQPCVRPGASRGFIICSPSRKGLTPCIKTSKGGMQPCIKTKKGFLPCIKPNKGGILPCVKPAGKGTK